MDFTISLDEETLLRARNSAETLGKSLDQLVRDYLEQLGKTTDPVADAAEFRRLSLKSRGRSGGWKFNRDELHKRD